MAANLDQEVSQHQIYNVWYTCSFTLKDSVDCQFDGDWWQFCYYTDIHLIEVAEDERNNRCYHEIFDDKNGWNEII